jgi:hypothetical protein
MQELTENVEPPIPTEIVSNDPDMNRTFTEHRRAAKRTLPWDLPADELEVVSPPQADEIQATKRPRLEKPFPALADEATTKSTSDDTTVAIPLPPPPPDASAADHHRHADSDLFTSEESSPVAESTQEEDFPPQQQLTSVDGDTSSQNSGDPPGQQQKLGQQPQYPMHPHPPQQQTQMPYGTPPQGNDYRNYYGGQMPMHPWQQRGPTGPHPGYHSGQYIPPQQMPGPGMYQRQMYLGMPNMPPCPCPNMMLGPGGIPYYPGQGGQMPYPQYGYEDNSGGGGGYWGRGGGRGRGGGQGRGGGRNVSVCLPSPPAADGDDASVDPVMDTQPNVVATRATGRWTTDEDAKLTSTVASTSKKMWGNEFKVDWDAVAALVPGRTRLQCFHRWKDSLDPIIDRTTRRTGTWTEDEDTKLKDVVQTHGEKSWSAISPLVPDRSRGQCRSRWQSTLDPSIDRKPPGRWTKWTAVEDSKLKDAIQMHGGKDWAAITALVPSRTRIQCWSRWHDVLIPSIDRANGRTGKWAEDEDSKLKDAVERHGGKNWGEIAALVPGRTRIQCHYRWQSTLNPSIALTAGRTGKWTPVEDDKLKYSVQMHGDKNWAAITALVPGRTIIQCCSRWQDALNPSIDRANGRMDKWEADEVSKLKDAVKTHGDKDWVAVSALLPDRSRGQCRSRWHYALNPGIALAGGSKGKWTLVEDTKLKDAVQIHDGKDWAAITALVPGRTKIQCQHRWKHVDPNRSTVRVKGQSTRQKAPALGQDPPCP